MYGTIIIKKRGPLNLKTSGGHMEKVRGRRERGNGVVMFYQIKKDEENI